MLEFPTLEQALAWYHSPEYAQIKAIRLANARNDIILVDALADNQSSTFSFSADDTVRLDAFFAEAERQGVPADRFHPGEPIESVVPAPAAAAASGSPPGDDTTVALEQVFGLLPALDAEGRSVSRRGARCSMPPARRLLHPKATSSSSQGTIALMAWSQLAGGHRLRVRQQCRPVTPVTSL